MAETDPQEARPVGRGHASIDLGVPDDVGLSNHPVVR